MVAQWGSSQRAPGWDAAGSQTARSPLVFPAHRRQVKVRVRVRIRVSVGIKVKFRVRV